MDDGCEEGFEMLCEINDIATGGFFVDDIFIYVNNKNKLNYAIEDKTFSITTLNGNYLLLGYLSSLNRIYLMDKSHNVISYSFPISFINYQMKILKGDLIGARKVKFYYIKIFRSLKLFQKTLLIELLNS